MTFRQERDTFGELQVPADRYWGAQTQRCVGFNFLPDVSHLHNVGLPRPGIHCDVVYS